MKRFHYQYVRKSLQSSRFKANLLNLIHSDTRKQRNQKEGARELVDTKKVKRQLGGAESLHLALTEIN